MHLRKITSLLMASALAFTGAITLQTPSVAAENADTSTVSALPAAMPLSSDPKIKAWQDLKFGLFIHWGVYSEYAGFVGDKQQTIGYPEQIKAWEKISDEDYLATAAKMTIADFNPNKWCQDAKDAGMKYLLVTSKHHDGFTMFKSETTTFDFSDAAPGQRDPLKELADACQAIDMKLAFYFSIIDWTKQTPEPYRNVNPLDDDMMSLIKAQLKELLSGRYGQVPELWFDMGGPTPEQSEQMATWVREFSPTTVVNSRVWNDKGDFEVGGDNALVSKMTLGPWESIRSTFPECWGYCRWPKVEATRQDPQGVQKQTKHEVHNLFTTIANGGQYLLNVGPKGSGAFDPFDAAILKGIGEWNKRHPNAIHGAVPTYYPTEKWGYPVINGNAIYLGIRKWENNGEIRLRGAGSNVTSVTIDDATNPGQTLTYRVEDNKDLVITLPDTSPDDILPVIKVATDGVPTYYPADAPSVEKGHMKSISSESMMRISSPKDSDGTAQNISYVRNDSDEEVKLTVGAVGGYKGDIPLNVTINGVTVKTTGATFNDGIKGFTLAPHSLARVIVERADKTYYAQGLGGTWGADVNEMWFGIEDSQSHPITIHHEFVSADETPLPAELIAKTPSERETVAGTPKVSPTTVAERVLTIGDYNWVFKGWDAQTKSPDGSDTITFTGTWQAGPLRYPLSYRYESGSPDHQMPVDITYLVPRTREYDKGSEITLPHPRPDVYRDRTANKTWRWMGWNPASIDNFSGPTEVVGTWEYQRDQDITATYVFKANDDSELPEAVTALLPESSVNTAPVSRIVPTFPANMTVQVENGEWEFDGYDRAFINWPAGPTETFTGTWHFQKKRYDINFVFEAADPTAQLPESVTNLLPRAIKVIEGEGRTLPMPRSRAVKAEGGIWSFDGWETPEVSNVQEPATVKGTWSFVAGEVGTPTYAYVSGDPDAELPSYAIYYAPTPDPYIIGTTVNAPVLESKILDLPRGGAWKLVGWTPEKVENAQAGITFTATWVPVPAVHTVGYAFNATSGELPESITALLPESMEVAHGSAFTPTELETTSIDDIEGTWTFNGWDIEDVLINDDLTVTGTWTCSKRAYEPAYNFGTLPDVVVALHDQTLPVEFREGQVCAPAPVADSLETDTEIWSFTGWEKECYTLEEALKTATIEGLNPSGVAGGTVFFAVAENLGIIYKLPFAPQWSMEEKPQPQTPNGEGANNGGTGSDTPGTSEGSRTPNTTPSVSSDTDTNGTTGSTAGKAETPTSKVVINPKGTHAHAGGAGAIADTGAHHIAALSLMGVALAGIGAAMRRRRR